MSKFKPFDEHKAWKIDPRGYGLGVVDEWDLPICVVDQRDACHFADAPQAREIAKQIAALPRLRSAAIHLLQCLSLNPSLAGEVYRAQSAVEEALDADGEKGAYLRDRGWIRTDDGLWEHPKSGTWPVSFGEAYWEAVREAAREASSATPTP